MSKKSKITVKDAKIKLQALLNELESRDENSEFLIDVSDNSGGDFLMDLDDISIDIDSNGVVWMELGLEK